MSTLSSARWTTLTSRAVLVPRDDIDTDQIIPARFLTTTTRAGLGAHCFADWRYTDDGVAKQDFPLNHPDAVGAQILVAGNNFGCGSSREHAPWSLVDAGFRAIIAGSFADIFRSNAHKNGLLTISVGNALPELHHRLRHQPQTSLSIDLAEQSVTWAPGHARQFSIDAFSKRSLLLGLDELGLLMADLPAIEAWENRNARSVSADVRP